MYENSVHGQYMLESVQYPHKLTSPGILPDIIVFNAAIKTCKGCALAVKITLPKEEVGCEGVLHWFFVLKEFAGEVSAVVNQTKPMGCNCQLHLSVWGNFMMYEPTAGKFSSDVAAGDDWQYVLQFLEESLGGQG